MHYGVEFCAGVIAASGSFFVKEGHGIKIAINATADHKWMLEQVQRFIGGSLHPYHKGPKGLPISQRKKYWRLALQAYDDIERFIRFFDGGFMGKLDEDFCKLRAEFNKRMRKRAGFDSKVPGRTYYDERDEQPRQHIGLPGDY